ncbi:glycosyl hydrolase family 18 protein [Arhodomonas sp. AD133]|uniref:glycosyl hydrolase family 18 protein n=1 Tax=Arhodomonas sp. AD133 TaxID=3415009 RepID=UPI003EBEEFA9
MRLLRYSLCLAALLGAQQGMAADCKPKGLYDSPNADPNYCAVYDGDGRETLGDDHGRRIIGYFTSWRNGNNGLPAYLVDDIPWDKVTHINYAFASVGEDNRISIGDTSAPDNPAVGMTWPSTPGAEMDPELPYQGHFNLLTRYKRDHPGVKTLISVGGWAESTGFYEMTTNADGSINHQGIETFADSVVEFLRTYEFDGVDIDYEYPTSMSKAGNPADFDLSEPRRGALWASYEVLMRTLRERLDAAGEADETHYMLTVAAPASGYLLRGMETFQVARYLDYINIMSYDLHGAWNRFVGHNASLYDTGEDAELEEWNVYSTSQYGGIGYLNTDWAVHYFQGAVAPGRINIGIPYYTRGWQGVSGGENGLWGEAPHPDSNECAEGLDKCGWGAVGIDNLWHDKDAAGEEIGAGSNPLWHAKNLEQGIEPAYLTDWGLTPSSDPADVLSGDYTRHYDEVAKVPWLWNAEKNVFLSLEDETSMAEKVDYVKRNGLGGVMMWELAGDYAWHEDRGEYYFGETLTTLAYDGFVTAAPYAAEHANRPDPMEAVAIDVELIDFALGDNNYPISPTLRVTNNTAVTLPGGTVFEFDVPTSTSGDIADQSGAGLAVTEDGSNPTGNNVGGLLNDFHRVRFSIPGWKSVAPGESLDVTVRYYLPIAGPGHYTVRIGGTDYALASEFPGKPLAQLDDGDTGDGGGDAGSCADQGIETDDVNTYPDWPRTDWQGNPSHAKGGDRLIHDGILWEAKWWTQSEPGTGNSWKEICTLQ